MKKIVVFGDAILDEYVYSKPLGLSAETPTIVGKLERKETFAGGGALVVRHLLRLGCRVHFVSHYGAFDIMRNRQLTDAPTDEEMDRLQTSYICTDQQKWKMNRKTRFFVGDYKYFQLDDLNEVSWNWLHAVELENLKSTMADALRDCDGLVICDNNHGTVNTVCLLNLFDTLKKRDFPVYVDTQISQKHKNIREYTGLADFFFMNEREMLETARSDHLEHECQELVRLLGDDLEGEVVLKLGSRGCVTKDQSLKAENVPVVDTCGAGDAFLAGFVSSDHDLKFANHWAARSVQMKGTRVPEKK